MKILKNCIEISTDFNIHGSVHLGNVYVRLSVQLDAHYIYSLFLYISLLTMLKV
jgi:hypothetical protein